MVAKRSLRSLAIVLGVVLVVCLPHATQTARTATSDPSLDNWHAHPPIALQGNTTPAASGYTPAQVRHAYGVDSLATDGSGQIIGIVEAYDDPAVGGDLRTFIAAFGLRSMNGLPGTPACTVAVGPHPCFQKVDAQNPPPSNGSWTLETVLDTQWAHAIAPGADILLVEAKDDTYVHLFGAVDTAVGSGAHVVSMSWGGPEFAHEVHDDHRFAQPGVTFVASSGDSGSGVQYPAASPYVIAVGGTTLPLDSQGNVTGPEIAWGGSGGGISAYESEPTYQSDYLIPGAGGKRSVPDVAYDADPSTGVAVYESPQTVGQPGWWQVGGTSIGAPQWAALIALADQVRSAGPLLSTDLTSSPVYTAASVAAYASNYRDITMGSNGPCGSVCAASVGYDFVTGLGSPLASALVPYLAMH